VFVSRQLGHASPDITLRIHAHLFDRAAHAERARAGMEAAFGNLLETTGGEPRPNNRVALTPIPLDDNAAETGGG
jgi:hypothetical protein